MDPALLLDPKLVFVISLAGVVALLGSLNVAARPAAVLTGRVALAFTVSSVFFMVSRFANMFYLPLMASFVDQATRLHQTEVLFGKIQWVIVGSAAGALAGWVLLPNFVALYCLGIEQMDRRHSMVRVVRWALTPSSWPEVLKAFLSPPRLGVRLLRLAGVPADFLWFNVFATAVWTVGALSAIYVSAQHPEFKSTAVLLSGLVNAFAAIAFSVWVDPKAALITDQARNQQRPAQDVHVAAVHLAAGNFLGAVLGLVFIYPGVALIGWAAKGLGAQGGNLAGSLWMVVLLNLVVTMLASTTYASRVSAVLTRRVATAISIYNLFFLVTRLAGQVYAPVLGAVADHVVDQHRPLGELEAIFRWVLLGASIGALLGLLLLPTFIEIYIRAIGALDRLGSIPAVLMRLAKPRSWPLLLGCLRRPTLFGANLREARELPRGFLLGNVLVLSIHTTGVMAAIYAGAHGTDVARTANLLSSVVNGLATITLSILVDPMCALVVDQAVDQRRPARHVYVMATFLMLGMLGGTLLSQVVFLPAAWLIETVAHLLNGSL